MKTCRDCKRFIGLYRVESKDLNGNPLVWNEFRCNRKDIPCKEQTFSEQACMLNNDGIYRCYQSVNNDGVRCASECIRFIEKTKQSDLF